jgi:hypothetical protein
VATIVVAKWEGEFDSEQAKLVFEQSRTRGTEPEELTGH